MMVLKRPQFVHFPVLTVIFRRSKLPQSNAINNIMNKAIASSVHFLAGRFRACQEIFCPNCCHRRYWPASEI